MAALAPFVLSDSLRLSLLNLWRGWKEDPEAHILAYEGFAVQCDPVAPVDAPNALAPAANSIEWLAPADGAAPKPPDLMHWLCVVPGPEGSAWEGARIPLLLVFKETFPAEPPVATFGQGFFHPNIYPSGKVCFPLLSTPPAAPQYTQPRWTLRGTGLWRPSTTVKAILRGIQALLAAPDNSDAAQEPAWRLLDRNPAAYEARVRLEAQKYGAEAPTGAFGLRLGSLGSDLGRLLESGEGADVTLACGTARIPAHSFILCARSRFWAAQLRGPLAADLSAVPVAAEINEHTLRRTLSYIYTGELTPESPEEAQHLLNAADVYALPGLLRIAERALLRGLCIANAAATLTLAEQHGVPRLKAAALRFVVRSGVLAVMATPGWAHLRQAAQVLVEELLHTAMAGTPPGPQPRDGGGDGGNEDERRVRQRT
jgi:ubiquitin-conjugating enzyme E2 I